MQKLKRGKKPQIQLDPATKDAIDKTVEAAISSKMIKMDHHIRQTIKSCLTQQIGGSTNSTGVERQEHKLYNPEAGP